MPNGTPTSAVAESERESEAAVRAVLRALVANWAANDADRFADLYSEDATIVTPGGFFRASREAIRAHMTAGFAGPMRGSRCVDEPRSVRIIGGDAAVVISGSGVVARGEAEISAEQKRLATWVLSKHGGRWFIDSYHNC